MTVHVPILAAEVVAALTGHLAGREPGWVVDCTLGGGGHTAALLEALSSNQPLREHRVLAVDHDPQAVERGCERFAREISAGRLEIARGRFGSVGEVTAGRLVHGLFADLGFSSDQVESSERGLSFMREGPLDMRMDPSLPASALDLLHRWTERQLADALHELGEERFSQRIARAVAQARRESRLPRTTTAFAELVRGAVPPPARHGRIHPATRTFQALRIAVNDELGQLKALLDGAPSWVAKGGRVVLLTFHSLEDRLAKTAFKGDERYRAIGKKPVAPSEAEVESNPRSRSAKLRVAEIA